MRGLTIVVGDADPARFRTALRLAATQAALGGRTRLFLDEAAVALAAGEPQSRELLETALALGAALILCQSGLAALGLDMRSLDPRFQAGGLTTVMGTLADDRLVAL